MESNKFLKVTGIIMIIGGIVTIILAIIGLLGVGVLAALGLSSGMLTLGLVLGLVGGVVELIAGISGVKNAAKPEKANSCIVCGILVIVLSVVGTALTMAGGGEFPLFNLLLGLVLPVLYLIGAFQNKKRA
jgi:hypothetical protein